jgi:branched-chain amino acid transport system ATP-binding protein
MAPPLLELAGVCAGYGRLNVLKDVSLEVHPGEIVTLIGANGAGKTTTLMAIAGLAAPSAGHILHQGRPIERLGAHAIVGRGICLVPEGRRIFSDLTVLENLELGAYRRRDAARVREDFERVYALFPILKDRRSQLGGTLSGGEQQMLAIGRALMARPGLLLLDEPSLGLSPLFVEKIFSVIRALNAEGTTILLVEQNAHEALAIAKRGYVMETGAITLHDEARALLKNPKVREAYLGE